MKDYAIKGYKRGRLNLTELAIYAAIIFVAFADNF